MRSKINILVVDDELQVRNVLEQILHMAGYAVESVKSGEEALKYIAGKKVDLVISDIRMPGMSGFDLLKAIKNQYPNIGVVIMTGYGDAYSVKEALHQGADEYITKPFKGNELSLIIERICWRFLKGDREDQIIPAKKATK